MLETEYFQEEKIHLEDVNKEINYKLEKLDKEIVSSTKKIAEEKKGASEAEYISLDINKEKYNDINEVQYNPYFARMDFKFDGEENPEIIYIGKIGIEVENEKNNIIDWRTPVGHIYYKGSLGACNHMFSDEKGIMKLISGTKLLKRSIEIKDKKIVKIQDLETLAETKEKEVELTDKYLIEVLKQSSSIRLKDIIATIQETQNSIIREELNKIVLIQGCAGSGKSTIALHRIAYLLYYYKEKLRDEDILVIAPNKLFIQYISKLLPDLGVINIRQETFTSLAQNIIDLKVDFQRVDIEKVDLEKNKFNKGLLEYKNVLDKYCGYLLENVLPKKSLNIYGKVLYTKEQLRKMFFEDFKNYKLNQRVEKFKTYIEKITQEKIKEYVLEKENEYNDIIEEFKIEAINYSNFKIELAELVTEKEAVIKRIKKQSNIIVSVYLNNIRKVDCVQKYIELMTDKMVLSLNAFGIIRTDDINNIIQEGKIGLNEDDIAGILYIYAKLNDINKNMYKHIVIDESQDLSPLEIVTLRNFVYNDSFTIVGDINQRIIPNKVSYAEGSIASIFNNSNSLKKYNLNRSYRSSYEIMMFAKEILKFNAVNKEYLPDPIERHGDRPIIIGKYEENQIIDEIVKQVKNRDENLKNVAIVFRNIKNCKKYYDMLKSKIAVDLVEEDNAYNGGICIFPAYLTKGFEYDMVIIGDCDDKCYRNNQLEKNLLYVQSTRAMHSLIIMYKETMSPLLLKISKEFYDEKETDQDKSIKVKAAKESLITILNAKFGGINEQIDEIIKEELNYNVIQNYITKAAIENKLDNIFNLSNKIKEIKITKENREENKEAESFKDKKEDNFYKRFIDDLLK